MPEYNVAVKRLEPGQYLLSYGRGKLKICVTTCQQGSSWTATECDPDAVPVDFKGRLRYRDESLKKIKDWFAEVAPGLYGTPPHQRDKGSELNEEFEPDPEDLFGIETVEDYVPEKAALPTVKREREKPYKEPPVADVLTDFDLLALDRLVGRYGAENLIKMIGGYSQEQLKNGADKAIRFRHAVQDIMRTSR
jgi:hypothetical protein